MSTSDASPVTVTTVAALTFPAVRSAALFRSLAATEVSLNVTAWVPKLEILPPNPDCNARAVAASAAVPVIVATFVAFTVPDVWPASDDSVDAAKLVSLSVTSWSPKLEISAPAVDSAVLTSAALPVSVATLLAFTTPLVFPFRVLRTLASSVVSSSVTASSPRPLKSPDAYTVFASAAEPASVVTDVASTFDDVLDATVVKSAGSTVVSPTVMVRTLLDAALVSVVKVATSCSVTVAVMTPVRPASIAFTFATDAVPLDTVSAAVVVRLMPADPIAVTMAASVPVIVVTASAFTAVELSPSIVFKSAASTEPASTTASNVPLCVTPSEDIASAISDAVPVISVAVVIVIFPEVAASTTLMSAASSDTSLTVAATSAANVVPTAANTDFTDAIAPVMVSTAVASTSTLVTPFTVAKSVAAASVSVTVIVSALLPLAFVRVTSVAKSPSEIVAVMAEVVSASSVFACATVAVPLLTFNTKSPSSVTPAASIAVIMAAAVPVRVVTALASTATEVTPSTVFKSAAFADASVTVTVSALFPLASVSVTSVARSPSEIVAVIAPVVSASRIFACATLAFPLLTVTA